jgi:hypothetical protein
VLKGSTSCASCPPGRPGTRPTSIRAVGSGTAARLLHSRARSSTRFHEPWTHDVERAFGLHRGPCEGPITTESPALDPEVAANSRFPAKPTIVCGATRSETFWALSFRDSAVPWGFKNASPASPWRSGLLTEERTGDHRHGPRLARAGIPISGNRQPRRHGRILTRDWSGIMDGTILAWKRLSNS